MTAEENVENLRPLDERSPGNREAETAPRLPFPPVVMGIAGCSGSGKTTLAAELARELDGTHFPIDHYYRDLAHLPLTERFRQNFDDPELIEHALLAAHVGSLAKGSAIERPLYDFTTHTRIAGRTEQIEPGRFLIVEGVFALHYAELLPLYQLSIFIDAPDEMCFEGRLKRDIEQRGRTAESVRLQYDSTVRPAAIAFVRPSAARADLVLDGTGALDWKVERVVAELRGRGLLANLRL